MHSSSQENKGHTVPCAWCIVLRMSTDGVKIICSIFTNSSDLHICRLNDFVHEYAKFKQHFHLLFTICCAINLQRKWYVMPKEKRETFPIIPKVITAVRAGWKIRQISKSALLGKTNHVALSLPQKLWSNITYSTSWCLSACIHLTQIIIIWFLAFTTDAFSSP